MPSIESRLTATNGRPSGFDYMRLLLAIGVIAMHSVIVTQGQASEHTLWASGWRPLIRAILPMFFALSGFLVAGSFERSRTLPMFFALRVIRIYPALLIEVILSALVLGVMFTEFPMRAYLGSPTFHLYMLNMLGDPHYELPGVFLHNPFPGQVNRQLWTVPYELACYVALAGIGLVVGRKRPSGPLLAAGLLTLAYVVGRTVKYAGHPPFMLGPVAGPLLVVCFLVGVGCYGFRDRLPMSNTLGVAMLALGLVTVGVVPSGEFLAPWPLAFATVWLGTANPRRVALLRGADYSYGLFLYGYPIQQALIALLPGHSPAQNTMMTVALAGGFAALSWTLVEKPALRLRAPMSRWEDRYLARRQAKHAVLAPGQA